MASAVERIFVVGVPRSGTTLVQSLLAAHGRTTSFTESHFFSRHFRLLPPLSIPILTRSPAARLEEFLKENGVEAPEAEALLSGDTRALLRTGPLLAGRTRAVARRLLRILDELATRRGKTCWIEKTPRHLRYVPFLERLSEPGARTRFVHVIRDGLEVVSSLYTASQSWERPYDLDTCVRRWNADVAFSATRLQAPHDCFVCYEELTMQPAATLERLLSELGLEFEPDLVERRAHAASRLITTEETWKGDASRAVRPSATSDRALTAEQRDRVRGALRADLYGLFAREGEQGVAG